MSIRTYIYLSGHGKFTDHSFHLKWNNINLNLLIIKSAALDTLLYIWKEREPI